ncbi:MAG: HU family DNA-binding protein [Burkholderiales bacterium]|nr:HU family DNA-binding protein [Burkholderiales bacterium]
MNKVELVKTIAEKTYLTRHDVSRIVDCIMGEIMLSLSSGRNVNLTRFGKFTLVERRARTYRNPKTGEAVDLDAIMVPKFIPSKLLKNDIANFLCKKFN